MSTCMHHMHHTQHRINGLEPDNKPGTQRPRRVLDVTHVMGSKHQTWQAQYKEAEKERRQPWQVDPTSPPSLILPWSIPNTNSRIGASVVTHEITTRVLLYIPRRFGKSEEETPADGVSEDAQVLSIYPSIIILSSNQIISPLLHFLAFRLFNEITQF